MTTTLTKSPIPPHHTRDKTVKDYYSPRPAPRVKPEASESYKKHLGTVGAWFDQRGNRSYNSPRPPGRCPSPESKMLRQEHEAGHMGDMLGKSANFPKSAPRDDSHSAVPRVKPEAQDIAEHHKGGNMSNLMHSYGKLPRSARAPPRVKPEAEETAENHKGKGMSNLLHSYGRLPLSARAVPRVKPEAEESATLDKGGRMSNLLHRYGKNQRTPRPVPRVKPEAEETAWNATGHGAQRLLQPQLPTPRRPRTSTEFSWGGHSRGGTDRSDRSHRRSTTAAW